MSYPPIGGSLVAPLQLPAVAGKPLTTQGGSTLDDGSGNVTLAGYLRARPVATTGTAGYALVNGTGTIISWQAPNDGKLHAAVLYATYTSSASITGGQVAFQILSSTLSVVFTASVSLVSGTTNQPINYSLPAGLLLLQPGQYAAIVQSSALTAGTVTVWASIYADM